MILSKLEKRTIRELRENLPNRKIYVFCKDEEIAKRFLEDAEDEGFRIGKRKPTKCETSNLFAIENKHQISYCGFCGHMALGKMSLEGNLSSVDYAKYVAGENDFLYRKDPVDNTFIKLDHFGTVRIVGYRKDEAAKYIRSQYFGILSKTDEVQLLDKTEELFNVIIIPENQDSRSFEKNNNPERFEIILLDDDTDEIQILSIFDTKEEAIAYGEKQAENITDEYTLACVSNHIIENGRESYTIHEVWDTISDRIIKELEEDEHISNSFL